MKWCLTRASTVPQGRICPHCGSADTVLLRGNEFEVASVEAA